MVSCNAVGFQYSGHNASVSIVMRDKFCPVLQPSSFALQRQKTRELLVTFSDLDNTKLCELITVEIRKGLRECQELKP
jgi:hypothetical protein